MDEPIRNSNRIITHSVQDDKYKVIQVKVADLNKKRKLEREEEEEEELFLPLSKHQFGYRRSGFEQEQPSAEKSDENEVIIIGQAYRGKVAVQLADESSVLGSAKDSNSFVGGSASTLSWNPENENILEAEDHAQSIISSGSCSSSLKDTLNSLHTRIANEPERAIGREDQVVFATTDKPHQPNIKDDVLQLGSGAQFSIDQLHQFDEHTACICVPYQVDGLDDELEDILLYSNAPPSEAEAFVLSSGRGNKDKDAQAAARRPTIDQEFEQYFSSLMLL